MRTPILAYFFDEAVGWFGAYIEGKLAERDKKGRPKYELDKLLGARQYASYKRD